MSPQNQPFQGRRGRALLVVLALIVVMCVMIAWAQWYAIHVNVPMYRAQQAQEHHR
ncbi:MAG: hypothetical protein WA814_10940 [Candidatus Baltobacteraceae bacterium]